MAIVKPPKKPATLIQNFYRKNQRYSFFVVVAFQMSATIVFAIALHMLDILKMDNIIFWTLVWMFFLLGLSINLLAMSVLIEPLKATSIALAHAAGEDLDVKPPNPNDLPYAHNGTKSLLELIYGLSSETARGPSKNQLRAGIQLEEGLADSRVGVALLNKKGEVVYANARAPISLGSRGKKRVALSFNNGDRMQLPDWIKQCQQDTIHAEKTWTRLRTLPSSTQEDRFFDVVASYSKGGDIETTLFFIDRTNNYANDEKDLDFIAFAAHELRGPITIIRGYLEVLSDELGEKLTPDQRVLFGRLAISANRLTTYLNNILNVSRYDRNHYAVHLSEQSLYEMYESISDDMSGRASSQNRVLTVAISPDLPHVAADPSSISEVFSNLIDNAVKYSSEGGIIEVFAAVAGDFVEVTVRDHGIGMPDGVVRNLFHKFYRSHRSRESVAGSGIGLYISKGIIDSHGGTISVSSSENRGSTFTFSLPIYATVEEKLKAGDNETKQSLLGDEKKTWISNHNMYRG